MESGRGLAVCEVWGVPMSSASGVCGEPQREYFLVNSIKHYLAQERA
jgi:hypothetical protein